MKDATRAKLAEVSTATLTTVLFKRGFRNVFLSLSPLGADAPRLVGPAYTLRTIPAREDLDTLDVFKDPTHPQRKGVEECPPGAVMVIDSLNTPKVRVTAHSANLYEVEITGDSDIWVVLLAGILRGMADDYGALVVIAIEGRVLRIDIALSEYGVMRPFALIAENTNQVQT